MFNHMPSQPNLFLLVTLTTSILDGKLLIRLEFSIIPWKKGNSFPKRSSHKSLNKKKNTQKRNTIEMQSITALAHLRAAVLFIIDPSEQCGFTLTGEDIFVVKFALFKINFFFHALYWHQSKSLCSNRSSLCLPTNLFWLLRTKATWRKLRIWVPRIKHWLTRCLAMVKTKKTQTLYGNNWEE